MTKNAKSQDRDTLKSPWLMPQGTLTKNCPFLENTFEPYLSLDRSDTSNLKLKANPFKTNPHMRRDASTWKAIYGMHRLLWVDKSWKKKKEGKEKEKSIVMSCTWKIRSCLNKNQERKKNVLKNDENCIHTNHFFLLQGIALQFR